jgi:hypothetical protein
LISQFTGNSALYSQVNQQNLNANGTGDFVITTNNGSDTVNYADMGMAGNNYNNTTFNAFPFVNPNDGYFLIVGNDSQNFGGNVFYGTTGSGGSSSNVGDIVFIQGTDYAEAARFVRKQGLVLNGGTASVSNSTGALVVKGGIGANGAIRGDSLFDSGTRVINVAQAAFDKANAGTAGANSYTDTANANMKLYVDGNISTNVATLRGEITANATSANSVIDTRISANVATLRGEISGNVSTLNGSITANAVSANSVIDTRITANVATLRGEISSNVATINGSITANAASANAVINANISANVATLRGEITANAVSANSVINTNISANVATLRGEISSNVSSLYGAIASNVSSINIDTNSSISSNVANLRSEITANAVSANSVINTNISANVATLRGEITANAVSANSVINTNISANVATLRGEITSNVSTLNSSINTNAASANAAIDSRITANVATLRGEITANAVSANSVINTNISSNVSTLRGEISSNVATLNGSITANAASANSVINTNISANVATLRGEITANAVSANSVINTNISANVATLRGEISSNVATLRGEITSNNTTATNQANAAYAHANAAYTLANTKFSSSGGTITGTVNITQDLNVTGNLIISGNTTSISANDLVINDSIIFLANNNTSNILDIGLVGHFTTTYLQHTGVIRDHDDGTWKFFSNVVPNPTTTVVFDANTIYDKIKVGGIDTPYANINGTDILTYSTSAYSTVNSSITNTNSYIASNVANLRSEITANAASANSVINTNISANVATLRGEITANADSANSVINSRISSNISSVFAQANAAYAHANAAYATANSGGGGVAGAIQPVYDQANAAYAHANASYGYANTLLSNNNSAIFSSVTIANTVFSNNTTVTSWVYSGKSKSVSAEESLPLGLFFSPDGLNLYVNGSSGDDVNQYTLSSAWDVLTASYVRVFSVASEDTAPQDIFFKPDGLTMFMLGSTNDTVYQYTLSTAWDTSTASYASKSFSVATQDATPQGLWFKSDGLIMYMVGSTTDTVYQYTLSTAWDVSTASYASKSFGVSAQETTPTQVNLSADGTKMWILGSTSDAIWEYPLVTPWDISSASPVNVYNTYIGFEETTPNGLFIDSTAPNRVYIIGSSTDAIYQYNTATGSIRIDNQKFFIDGSLTANGNFVAETNAYVDGSLTVRGATSFGTTGITGTLTASGLTTSTTALGTSATTGTTTIGGTTQTGSIIISPTTDVQSTFIHTGATTSGTTKTLYLGTGGVAGSFANILIGANTSGANGNTTLFGPNVVVSAANTAQTSFRVIGSTNATSTGTGTMTVAGGVGITGNVYSSGVYESVVSTTTRLFDSANLVMNARITANAVSANSVINTNISANVATLRGEITANAASANAVINANISANVATLRGEITANAASANSVINTNISANVATLRGEITANAASANSVINTNISANVATLRGEITANAASANAVINANISANVATLRGEITANAASANSVINTNISANVATLRGEITANADSANSVINSRITSNIATVNTFAQAAFDRANTSLTSAVTSLTANSNTRITQSATTGVVTFDLATIGTITPGSYTYPSIQVDAYGRTTTISSQTPVTTITSNSSSRITQSATSGPVLFDLATSGVTAGTYGSATLIPTITVDDRGRVTSASNNSISTTINLVANTGSGTVSGGGTLAVNGTNSIATSVSSGTYTITNNGILSFNTRTGAVTLTSSDVTTALGYTPANKAGDTLSGSFTGITNLGANTVTHSHSDRTTRTFVTASTSQVAVDNFSSTSYRSAKYYVQMTSGSSYHVIELSLVHNGTTVYLSQYGEIFTDSSLGTFDASITGSTLSLFLTAANSITTVKLIRDTINI